MKKGKIIGSLNGNFIEDIIKSLVQQIYMLEDKGQCDTHADTAISIIDKFILQGQRPDHRCRKLAVAPDMAAGREIWIGKLTEPVKGWEHEEYCLHWTTPLKSVVFLMNRADFRNLEILCRVILAHPTSESWLNSMVKEAMDLAEENENIIESNE
jgi:hypothetical protein